jgi:aspartyl/glutamyl-tRNA(Asn/Gln) amidotransferase C subunit
MARGIVMQIDGELLDYLEDLSCLTLADEEKVRLTHDLQEILDYMARLGELNTEGVAELSHPFDNVNFFRDDVVCPSYDRASILQNAPAKNDEMIIAPKTVE